jgi:hypothetical protein
MAGYFLVPIYGWQASFVVGLVPSVLSCNAAGFSSISSASHIESGPDATPRRITYGEVSEAKVPVIWCAFGSAAEQP